MTTTEIEPRAEEVLNVRASGRWPLATIHCFADDQGWHATLSYSYGLGGGGSTLGPFGKRESAILDAIASIDRGLPSVSGSWLSTPQADRARAIKIRAALDALRNRLTSRVDDLPIFAAAATPSRPRTRGRNSGPARTTSRAASTI